MLRMSTVSVVRAVIVALACRLGACTPTEAPPVPQVPQVQIWSGAFTTQSESQKVRFEIMDDAGKLTGLVYVEDPVTHGMIPAGTLSGVRQGKNGEWQIATGSVAGEFVDANTFDGTVTFSDKGWGTFAAQVHLTQ